MDTLRFVILISCGLKYISLLFRFRIAKLTVGTQQFVGNPDLGNAVITWR